MAGFSTTNTEFLTRTQVWAPQIKRVLEDELLGMRYVRMISHPDGDTLNLPSIGQASVHDYAEGQQVVYDAMDTGNFQFTIGEYKQTGTYITNKMKQDSFYMNELVSSFIPAQARAIAVAMEVDVLRTGPETQTSANANTINGAAHRMIGTGTSESMSVVDFQKARYALQKANVPMTNLVAIVDPTVEFTLATQTNLVNMSNPNPHWAAVVKSGLSTGTRFVTNIFGFDVYVSNNLKVNTASETIGGLTAAAGVHNLFFSATGDIMPLIGAVRQEPKVDSKYNMDWQREEWVTTCRYDFALFRSENFVDVITDTDVVS